MWLLLLLLRATALLCFALLASVLLRRRSAETRADLWRASFVALAVLPVAMVALPAIPWLPNFGASQTASAPVVAVAAPFTLQDALSLTMNGADSQSPAGDQKRGVAGLQHAATPAEGPALRGTSAAPVRSFNFALLAGGLWLVGAFVLLLRLVRGLSQAGSLARTAFQTPWNDLPGAVSIVVNENAPSPFVWDPRPFGSPVVVLDALHENDGESPNECHHGVLTHELHHVERRDGFFLSLASAMTALLWPSPLVHFALRKLRFEMERAADDAALRSGVRASEYAGALLALALARPSLPSPCIAAAGTIAARVEAVLERRVDRRPTGSLARRIAGTLAIGFCVPVATLAAASQKEAPAQKSSDQEVMPQETASAKEKRELRDRSMAALIALQDPKTGAWRGDIGFKLNLRWHVTKANAEHVGITGLAVEALASNGQALDDSAGGRALAAGIEFLLRSQERDGWFRASGSPLRGHAHAMRGLAAVMNAGLDAPVGEALVRALDFTLDARSEENGCWRNLPHSRSTDIIETAYLFDALATVQLALLMSGLASNEEQHGFIQDPEIGHGKVRAYANKLQNKDASESIFGGFRFQAEERSRSTLNTTAAGFRLIAGRGYRHEQPLRQATLSLMESARGERQKSLEASSAHFLTWESELLTERALDEFDGWTRTAGNGVSGREGAVDVAGPLDFALLIGSTSLPFAKPWRTQTIEWLAEHELEKGGWQCITGPGDAYTTAIGCLLLLEN